MEKKNTGRGKAFIPVAVIIGLILFVFAGTAIMVNTALGSGADTVKDSFSGTVSGTVSEIRGRVKAFAADLTEDAYHVSNYASISIGDLQKCADLEVLKVRESALSIRNGDELTGITSWIQLTETCEFVVDLTMAEFIIDNARGSVTVRAPLPEPANFTVEKQEELFSNASIISGSASDGAAAVDSQIKEADEMIRAGVSENQAYRRAAKESAATIIINAIRALNKDVKDLQVYVEFD